MIPIAEIPTISITNVLHAKLGDIVTTLRRHPLNYLLVRDIERETLRGIFSAKRIGALLQINIEPLLKARSTAEIAQAINVSYKF